MMVSLFFFIFSFGSVVRHKEVEGNNNDFFFKVLGQQKQKYEIITLKSARR